MPVSIKAGQQKGKESRDFGPAGRVYKFAPAIVFVLAVALRVWHVFSISGDDPAFSSPIMDSLWHVQWARAVALGLWEPEVFFRAPLYPFFLAGAFKVFGFGYLVPRLVQAAVGGVTCVLIWRLGRELAGRSAGLAAGVIAAIYAPFICFDAEFLIPVIFIPLTVASLLLLISVTRKWSEGRSPWLMAGIAGFVAGLASIARPNLLALVPGALLFFIWMLPGWKRRLSVFAVWLALFMAPVGAVTGYNAALGGGLVPVASQGGINFWIGNNPRADGKTAMAPGHMGGSGSAMSMYEDSIRKSAERVAERRLGRQLNPAQLSNYWFGQGLKFVKENPVKWMKLTVKKAYFLINGYELPSNRDIYSLRKWSPVLGVLLWKRPLGFPFGLLLPLAVAGLLYAWRNPSVSAAAHRLMIIYVVIYGAGAVAFFVTGRHRLPIVPALIPHAALAVSLIPAGISTTRKMQMKRPLAASVAMIGFGVMLALCNADYFNARDVPMREHHMNMGSLYTNQGRHEEALEEYKAALEEEPKLVRAQFNIGAVKLLMGDMEAAKRDLRKAIEMNPRFVDAWVHLGNVYFRQNRLERAEALYQKALSINPGHPLGHYNLALLYRRMGKREKYINHVVMANRADPEFVPANLALAKLLIERGRYDEARGHIKRVLRIDPQHPGAQKLQEMLP